MNIPKGITDNKIFILNDVRVERAGYTCSLTLI
jgi:hypothetical protein